jgi:copper oxidase (laccase) domain-containing protein
MTLCPVETFPALDALSFLRAAFLQRAPAIDVQTDRATVLDRLQSVHRATADSAGFAGRPFATAEQVHGAEVIRVNGPACAPGADALLTSSRSVCLAIYVADCAAVYLADRHGRGIGLVHSGKKGTELGIVPAAIRKMGVEFGCAPADLIVQISPCIRPPHYEVDIAAEIIRQARAAGVTAVQDCGTCTASHPDRYYSYRREKGKTGRLLALLALT